MQGMQRNSPVLPVCIKPKPIRDEIHISSAIVCGISPKKHIKQIFYIVISSGLICGFEY